MMDDKAIKTVEEILKKVNFFTDSENQNSVYVEYPLHNGGVAFEPVSSTRFEAFLGYSYTEKMGGWDNPNFGFVLQPYIHEAVYTQEFATEIHRRVAGTLKTGITYFLANGKGESVLVRADGWKVKVSKKYKFLKFPADEAQVMPVAGGDVLKLLRRYINMPDDDFKLFVVYLIQAFSRSSSHFAAIISSAKGTGKSTQTKLLREIVDPSQTGASLIPTSESDLKNTLANGYLVCFDNTAKLSEKFSNIMCAAITGTKEAKRKLYTDADQVVLNLHNLIVLNGIDIVPEKSDLAERSLYFELQKIPKEKRILDADFWEAFEADRPAIIGGIFDTLVKAMNILPDVVVPKLHRMADAHKEMVAIALALGIDQTEFQRIFDANVQKLQTAYAEGNKFVDTIVGYMGARTKKSGPARDIYEEVLRGIPGDSRFFPGSPSQFSRRLEEEKDGLKAAGYRIRREKKATANHITIEKIPGSCK